jgi:predicted nuclease of predicted toxin-antitoxin system
MKLLLDQGLPLSAASLLREDGIDTVHTAEIGYSAAEDADILDYARAESRIVATLDADFHALLALSGASSPSVIRIRVDGLQGRAISIMLQSVLQQCDEDLAHG